MCMFNEYTFTDGMYILKMKNSEYFTDNEPDFQYITVLNKKYQKIEVKAFCYQDTIFVE